MNELKSQNYETILFHAGYADAMLWLRNLTKGREEQQFILGENNEQSFH